MSSCPSSSWRHKLEDHHKLQSLPELHFLLTNRKLSLGLLAEGCVHKNISIINIAPQKIINSPSTFKQKKKYDGN